MEGIHAVRYVHLVHRGKGQGTRAESACRWYEQALGAHKLHHSFHESSVLRNTEIHHIFHVRVGPLGSGIILEVRDSSSHDRRSSGNNSKSGNISCYISSPNVDVLLNQILTTPVLGDAAQAVLETTAEENGHFIYTIRDPFGFKWILASSQLLPIQIQRIFHENDEALAGNISSIHIVYTIDHLSASEAVQWYGYVLGAVLVSESCSTIGGPGKHRYLRIGDGERRTIIELDSTRPCTDTEQSDCHAFIYLYSAMPRELHDRFITGLGMKQSTSLMINRSGPVFISKLRDPFGFHWFVKSIDPPAQ